MLSRRDILALGGATLVASCTSTAKTAVPAPAFEVIKRLRPKLDALIAPDAKLEQLANGITWAEGPVWVKEGGYVLLSDVPQNTIYKWTKPSGLQVFMQPSGLPNPDPAILREAGSNGLAVTGHTLFMCDSGSRALARVDLATKQKQIIADRFEGKRFNSPNDLCISQSGAIYFTDPPFGLRGINDSPAKELPFSGVYRLSPDGKLALVDKTLTFPNGVALSPDESILYVSNTDAELPILRAYRLGSDGLPTSQATFFDAASLLGAGVLGMPDGMKADAAGNLFASGPGGIMVLSPQAELLGQISAPGRSIANCAFGEDGSTLFLTAKDSLARLRLRTRGGG